MSQDPCGQLILDLYRTGREGPFRSFQTRALDLLRTVLAFDSAWWGNASKDTMQIHRIHLHNVAPSIFEDYPRYLEEDVFRESLIANPGVTISMEDLMPREEWMKARLYREYAVKYRVFSTVGTLLIDRITSLFEFLTVWRHKYRPFTPEERRIKQLVMPHLVEAHRVSRLHHVIGRELNPQVRHWAIADVSGHLHELVPGFAQMLREEWTGWTASRLPEDLHEAVANSGLFRGQRFVVRVRPLRSSTLRRGATAYHRRPVESARIAGSHTLRGRRDPQAHCRRAGNLPGDRAQSDRALLCEVGRQQKDRARAAAGCGHASRVGSNPVVVWENIETNPLQRPIPSKDRAD